MSSPSIPASPPSKKPISLGAQARHEAPTTSDLEKTVDRVFKDSLEAAKLEQEPRSRRLYQVLPSLTGQHSVGYTSFVIDGPKDTGGDSKIGIEIYAPSKKETGKKVPLEFPGDYLKNLLSPEQNEKLCTHSHDQMDPVEKTRTLIFSHGFDVPPVEYRLLLEELASHGNLVLSLNHPSSSAYAPFSKVALDGNAFRTAMEADPAHEEKEMERLASVQEKNIHHVVKLIRTGSGILGKYVYPTAPIVLAGHSLGGTSSIIASRNDQSIAACIDLDGSLRGNRETRTAAPKATTLLISSDHSPHRLKEGEKGFEIQQQIEQDFASFLKNPSVNSYTIEGIGHSDFYLGPVLHWLKGHETLANALKAHREASQQMLKFMSSIPM